MISDADVPRSPGGEEHLFYPNRQLLQPGLTAPVGLTQNTKRAFQTVLRQLLSLHEAHAALVDPVATTGGTLLFACQELVLACQALIGAGETRQAREACATITAACRELSGNAENLYAFRQAADDVRLRAREKARARGGNGQETDSLPVQLAPRTRFKKLTARLEEFVVTGPARVTMDLERLGRLQVHLDEAYDAACSLLELFYAALVQSPAPEPFAEFCEATFDIVGKQLLPDHILVHAGESKGKTADEENSGGGETRADGDGDDDTPARREGLLQLVPELAESLQDWDVES